MGCCDRGNDALPRRVSGCLPRRLRGVDHAHALLDALAARAEELLAAFTYNCYGARTSGRSPWGGDTGCFHRASVSNTLESRQSLGFFGFWETSSSTPLYQSLVITGHRHTSAQLTNCSQGVRPRRTLVQRPHKAKAQDENRTTNDHVRNRSEQRRERRQGAHL